MSKYISVAIFLSMSAQFFQPAFASEISIIESVPSGLNNSYLLSGEIQKGDAEKLAKAFMKADPFATMLYLDSPGGDVEESLRIVSLVKALHLQTVVSGGGICASACFFIWLAGDGRVAIGTVDGRMNKQAAVGYIGLHRPYWKSGPANKGGSAEAITRQHDVMQITSAYLRNQDVPQRLIDLMMSRPSNDIYWMTDDDVEQLGPYNPGLEELLISRCGYSRKTINDMATAMVMARQRGDSAAAAREQERMNAYSVALAKCNSTSFPDFAEESIRNTERLRKGWRPWLKSKVGDKTQ